MFNSYVKLPEGMQSQTNTLLIFHSYVCAPAAHNDFCWGVNNQLSMAMFGSYVKFPESICYDRVSLAL